MNQATIDPRTDTDTYPEPPPPVYRVADLGLDWHTVEVAPYRDAHVAGVMVTIRYDDLWTNVVIPPQEAVNLAAALRDCVAMALPTEAEMMALTVDDNDLAAD